MMRHRVPGFLNTDATSITESGKTLSECHTRKRAMNSLDYLLSFQRFGIKLGLDNITYLLERLGNPHHAFPSVHVTGTNGKGSVVAFIHSVLMHMGYKVGRFISPHLIDFSERISVNDTCITASEIDELVNLIRPIIVEMQENPRLSHPTFFEAVTAMAFEHFARHKVDFAVVEVGMGGRYDSTNVVEPCLSVITNVHLEHCDYLGDTLEQIAVEKAGIIKPGIDVVSSAEQPEVRKVIDARAGECGAKIYYLSRDFSSALRPENFPRQWLDFTSPWTNLKNMEINLAGAFQEGNAAVALMSLELLQRKGLIPADENMLRKGMADARWPARLEKLSEAPLMILDGAHNPSAMRCLVDAMSALFANRRILLVVGMLGDKDVSTCLRILRALGDTIIASQPVYERAMPAVRLAELARSIFPTVRLEQTLRQALLEALRLAAPNDIILIAGSLFNVAGVKNSLPEILSSRGAFLPP
ncbi:bifunctional folylpolyglutamate synthase/dihydrofolate synthase [Candidatus Poribacteria bacterium]|nr:bifunctional folylpolyglutamate synthase/dihydrofolate synthase [Candidatus Poribacteria bacterium]